MKKRLFVSYSRKDFELVDEFVESTEHFDFNVWIDKRDQEYGKKWRDSLTHAIDESDGAILFVTINSLNSRAVKELEIPQFLEQKDTRGENFKLYIVILDYVPEKLLEEFKTEQGEYIFKERHIKNVSANRLDSDQKLPSEMMPGARQKYWYKLCEEISEDINYLAEYKKPILKVSEKNKKNLKRLIKYSVSSSILFLILYAGYFGFNQLNNTVNNTLQNFNETLEGLSNSNNTNSEQEIDNQNPVVTLLEDSENLPTTIASSTTSTSTSTSTSTTTSTTIRVTPTTAPVDPTNGSSQIKLGEKYKLNILNQTYEWLDELFLQWANSARVYSVTQYEEGVVLSFTPLYDLNGYKLYLNGENIGSVNHFGAWYTKYNNVVLKGLKESEFYTLEIYVVDRYYREFGPITYDFQYVWNSDDGFPYNNLSYNEFNGILIGNFSNNTGGDGNERPILKSDLNNIDIATYDLGTNAYPRYQIIISNLVYEKFTHFVVVEGDQMIFLSNVLNFYITEDIFDKYIKIIPFNNIFNNGESVDLLITKSMFEN
jgi:hypothetical protein